jgi:hypothetical protein
MQAVEERVSTLEKVLEEFIVHTNTLFEESRINNDLAERRLEKKLEESRINNDLADRRLEKRLEESKINNDLAERRLEKYQIKTDMTITRLEESQINTDIALTRLERVIEESKVKNDIALTRLEKGLEEFKDEMKVFKDEMSGFKDRMEASHKNMNRQWADLAKKMGTLDEDLVSPAVRPMIRQYFKCDPIKRSIRELIRKDGDSFEVDVLAVCENKVFMIEVRATPRVNYVNEILEKVPLFRKFYPEYQDKEVIPIFASIIFPEHIVQYATRKGLYVMAYREWEYMDIINFNEVSRLS